MIAFILFHMMDISVSHTYKLHSTIHARAYGDRTNKDRQCKHTQMAA